MMRTRSIPHREEVVSVRIQLIDDSYRTARVKVGITADDYGFGIGDRYTNGDQGGSDGYTHYSTDQHLASFPQRLLGW
jgi:hypothetical protein